MGAESADFFFECWYLKVITDDRIDDGEVVSLMHWPCIKTQEYSRYSFLLKAK
jgi:hypothetical protein